MSFSRKVERGWRKKMKKVFIAVAKEKNGLSKQVAGAYFDARQKADKKKGEKSNEE